jgi:hypothetical protein
MAIQIIDGNGANYQVGVTSQGKLKVDLGGLITSNYDFVSGSYPTSSQEVYTFKSSGNVVNTVTINYTDSSKQNISTIQNV